jgi:hypothetical protein
MLTVARARVAQAPRSVTAGQLLGAAHEHLGRALHARGDKPGALEHFVKHVEVAREVLPRDPFNPRLQRDVWIAHLNLAKLHAEFAEDASRSATERRNQMQHAKDHFHLAKTTMLQMGDSRIVFADDKTALDEIEKGLAACEQWLDRNPTSTPSP